MFGEVCDEVFDQEVFECLSSGVQDIAWIDLKHIQIKVVGICNDLYTTIVGHCPKCLEMYVYL